MAHISIKYSLAQHINFKKIMKYEDYLHILNGLNYISVYILL